MLVGVGYTAREFCDDQSLTSPGRWPVSQRMYPDGTLWKVISDMFMSFAERHGTRQLLMSLAAGRVEQFPFDAQSVRELKESTVAALKKHGFELRREVADKSDLPIDFRYLDLLRRAAGDLEVHLGPFGKGVRVGPGAHSQEEMATTGENRPSGQPRREVEHRANEEEEPPHPCGGHSLIRSWQCWKTKRRGDRF